MNRPKYDTQKLWEMDRDHYIHPWTDFSVFKDEGSLVVAESEGSYVFDPDGTRYLDGIGGLWCVNIGYGNDEMADAIAEQARRMHRAQRFCRWMAGGLRRPRMVHASVRIMERYPSLADRIHQVVSDPFEVDRDKTYTTVSIGMTSSAHGYVRVEDVIGDVSAATDSARDRGRNRHEIYDTSMRIEARTLLADFRQVEQNFRDLDRAVRERITTWEGGRGELAGDRHGDFGIGRGGDRLARYQQRATTPAQRRARVVGQDLRRDVHHGVHLGRGFSDGEAPDEAP